MKQIKELRRIKGYSQAQLADMLGVSQATLSGWELDKWNPDMNMIYKIAKLFNVSMGYLLGWENESLKPQTFYSDKSLPIELIESAKDLSPEEIAEVIDFIEFLKSKQK